MTLIDRRARISTRFPQSAGQSAFALRRRDDQPGAGLNRERAQASGGGRSPGDRKIQAEGVTERAGKVLGAALARGYLHDVATDCDNAHGARAGRPMSSGQQQ